jgi:hypothetical protein
MNLRRLCAAIAAAVLVNTGLALVQLATAPAEAAWNAPAFVRSIGGNGRPGVFPWGVQYNPVSNEVIVGDYLNNQIRRYTPDGKIIGSFYRPNATGQPYSIGVDPRNGDIYVPEIADGSASNKVAQYTKDGTFVKALTLNGIDYQAWITIDANGNLIQADSHYGNNSNNKPMVRVWRLSDGKNTKSFNVWPTGTTSSNVPRIYGIDVYAVGNIWLTDTFNNRILKYNSTGTTVSIYGNGEFHGDARGMAVDDARNRLFVSDATVGQIRVYNLQGQFIETLGDGSGTGALNLGSARQPAVAPDGTLYVAEYGNARVHRFTADGDDAGYFPKPAQPAPPGQFGEPRDVDVDDQTGDVWVADSWNQRFQRFKSTGEFVGTWGTRSASLQYGMNYPRGLGIDPVSRRVWIANQRGHHIKRYEYDGTFVDQLGDAEMDSESPGYFRWPLDIEFYGGKAVVSDRNSSKVKILDAATGAETSSFTRSGNHGMAIDPANGNIYVADATKIYEYNSTGTSLTRTFGASGTGDGQFKHIWDMVVSNGVLYVTDDQASRIQAFSTSNAAFLGKWGGFGQGAYQFKNPSGIAAGADGLLYVADAGNDRVTVFDPSKLRGGAAWPPPVPTLSYPGNGATVPGRPVRLSGSVTDETAVASMQIAVQDTATGKWYDASNSTWSTTQTWANGPLVGDSTKNMKWAWTFIGVEYGGSYHAEVRGVDVAGNTSASIPVDFGVVTEGATDTEAPGSVLTSPAPDDSVALEPPLVISGEAADDTGVDHVDVRVRKSGTNQFLQPDGTFDTTAAWMPAALAEPATINTAWSYSWADPAAGSYEVATRSYDVLGNNVQTVLGEFTLTAVLPPDTTAPVFSSVLPTNNSTVASPGDITGVLTDDRAVDRVEIAIKNRANNLWLRPDGTWGAFGWLPTTLDSPAAASTTWTKSWGGTPGIYGYQLRAFDPSGNTAAVGFRSITLN